MKLMTSPSFIPRHFNKKISSNIKLISSLTFSSKCQVAPEFFSWFCGSQSYSVDKNWVRMMSFEDSPVLENA